MRTDVENMQLYDLLISDILYTCYDAYTFKEQSTRDSIEYVTDFLFNFDESPYTFEMIYQTNKELKSMDYKRMTKLLEDKVVCTDYEPVVYRGCGEWHVKEGYYPYKYYGEYDDDYCDDDCDYEKELPINTESDEKLIDSLAVDLIHPDNSTEFTIHTRPNDQINNIFKELNKDNMKIKKDKELLRLVKRVKEGNFLCLYNEENEPVEYIKLKEFEYGCSYYVKLKNTDDGSTKYFKYIGEDKRNDVIEKFVPINEPVLIEVLKNVEDRF